MARQVDYEALVAKLEVTDIYVAIHDDEAYLIAACMDCDFMILEARQAEVNACELHMAILAHDCKLPGATVIVDDQDEITDDLEDMVIDTVAPEVAETADAPAPALRVLHLTDRCDRCSAQAFVRIETGAGALDLCGHHYAKAALTILAAGYSVVDERGFINAKPSISATAE